MTERQIIEIERLGHRGEGVATWAGDKVFVPYGLPGDTILADITGERGAIVEIITPSPDRVAPICAHFGACGGCAVQSLAAAAYSDWKRDLLVDAVRREKLTPDIAPLIDAHGEGRRRATFHAREGRVGFMRARSHDILEIDRCPILSPGLAGAVDIARGVARALRSTQKPLDISITETESGPDVDFRGTGPLARSLVEGLIALAATLDLARLSNHGDVIVERRTPVLRMGAATLSPPPGAFLQATHEGEATLAKLVVAATGGARKIADLFCGVGTFALRLAARADVHAVESDVAALGALERAAHGARLRVVTERRDLFRRPLAGAELDGVDAVVFDPPRAGAEAQALTLAASSVATVAAVSCNIQTFVRDARILVDGGYVFERVTPVDQFRHSAHLEMVGLFRRVATRRPRRLLG